MLAGVGPASPAPVGMPRTSDAPLLVLDGCAVVETGVKVTTVTLRPFVPADFAITGDPVATVYTGGADCHATLGTTEGRAAFVWSDVPVRPLRADLEGPGIDLYMWRIEHFTLPDLYEQANDAVGATHTRMQRITVTADPALMGGEMVASAAGFEHHIRAPGPGLESAASNTHYREYGSATDGGYAYLEATYVSGADAQREAALFTPDPSSVAFQVEGPIGAGLTTVGNGYSFPGLAFGHI